MRLVSNVPLMKIDAAPFSMSTSQVARLAASRARPHYASANPLERFQLVETIGDGALIGLHQRGILTLRSTFGTNGHTRST